jgi:hypothetical protein
MQADWVMCPNGCGEKLFHMELSSHCLAVCRDRKEQCSYGCGELVKYRDRDKHKMLYCKHRFVQCKYAPLCKWTGLAKYLEIHLHENMTAAQKKLLVGDDLQIDCLERPFVCWHPPLIPSPDTFSAFGPTESTIVDWVGCGACMRVGDRSKHVSDICPFRMTTCDECAEKIIGSRIEEHIHGRAPSECRDTAFWLESGCMFRSVPCLYIVSTPLEGGDSGKQNGIPTGTKDNDEGERKKTIRTVKSQPKQRSVQRENSESDLSHVPWNMIITPQAVEAGNANLTVVVKQGCSVKLPAKELLAHQQLECTERFVYCRHGCGEFLKWHEQDEHEDASHLLQTDLHLAAEEGDLERVKDFVEGRDNFRRFAVNCRDDEGNNALHYAVQSGHAHVVRYLLAQGIHVNVPGLHGRPPLTVAAALGNVGIAEQLLRASAAVDELDVADGWTALQHASFGGHADVVEALLRSRAALAVCDARRRDTALHLAMLGGHSAVAQRLADAGADLSGANERRAKVFYHTFDKDSGRPTEVRRGDVAHDYARSGEDKRYLRPALDEKLAAISAAVTLDPRYGATFETAAAARRPSPAKERALGRSPSPTRFGSPSGSPARKSLSPPPL